MTELPVPREQVATRLRRIAGQVRGCARMVEEEQDCSDILTQMAAARGALAAVAALVLTNYTHICLEKEKQTGESTSAALARAFALWAAGPSDAPANVVGRKRKKTG
jgi:DNA-binding FrmR family transcriptional regulator